MDPESTALVTPTPTETYFSQPSWFYIEADEDKVFIVFFAVVVGGACIVAAVTLAALSIHPVSS